MRGRLIPDPKVQNDLSRASLSPMTVYSLNALFGTFGVQVNECGPSLTDSIVTKLPIRSMGRPHRDVRRIGRQLKTHDDCCFGGQHQRQLSRRTRMLGRNAPYDATEICGNRKSG